MGEMPISRLEREQLNNEPDSHINQFKLTNPKGKTTTMTTKTSKTNKSNVEMTDAHEILGHTIRFLESTTVPGAIGNVWFTPKDWNGLDVNIGSVYKCSSGLNAIRDFIAGTYQKAGEYVHVFNPAGSRYDGMKSFYLGGNLVVAAINEGLRSLTMDIAERAVTISLPSATDVFGPYHVEDVFGEWVLIKMETDFWGKASPATDVNHRNNIVYKHMFLDKLLSGTRLKINTDPAVTKENQLYMRGSQEAEKLRDELFNADGSPKTVEDVIKPYNERKLVYAGSSKLDRQTAHMMKVAPIIGTQILSVIKVEGQPEPIDVAQVSEGIYQMVDRLGNIRNYSFRVDGSLRSQNNLRTGATNGWMLRKVR